MFREFLSRLLRPNYVRLRVHVDVLPQFGEIGRVVTEQVESRWSLFEPKFRIRPLTRCAPQSANDADDGGDQSGGIEGKTEQVISSVVGVDDSARHEHSSRGVVHPLSDADAAEPGRDHGSIGPTRSDASDQRRSRDTRQGLPPIEILFDARNRHPAIPSPFHF